MATLQDLEQALLDEATEGIASTSVDGTSVTKQPLRDRLAVADRQVGATAVDKSHFGLRFTQLIPPGGGG